MSENDKSSSSSTDRTKKDEDEKPTLASARDDQDVTGKSGTDDALEAEKVEDTTDTPKADKRDPETIDLAPDPADEPSKAKDAPANDSTAGSSPHTGFAASDSGQGSTGGSGGGSGGGAQGGSSSSPDPQRPPSAAEKEFGNLWIRALFMIAFGLVAWATVWLVLFLSLLQFVVTLVNRERNGELASFTRRTVTFLGQTLSYVSLNRKDMPFPAGPFPKDD